MSEFYCWKINLFSFSRVIVSQSKFHFLSEYLFLDHNDLTGDINTICTAIPQISRATSDCAAPSYEINCTCCAVCCDDIEENTECSLHSENDFLALLEPQWTENYNRIDYSDFFPQYIYEFLDLNITR